MQCLLVGTRVARHSAHVPHEPLVLPHATCIAGKHGFSKQKFVIWVLVHLTTSTISAEYCPEHLTQSKILPPEWRVEPQNCASVASQFGGPAVGSDTVLQNLASVAELQPVYVRYATAHCAQSKHVLVCNDGVRQASASLEMQLVLEQKDWIIALEQLRFWMAEA